ncbi:MAG: SMC-Scp complex subunit ScpB [Candidatus Harrisonbacteria bacterium CG10_big_fil_rev_8_21_14_0_10_38_8]|uniref:SMC-Scp complex subunit ScpB n=1 Tax=Candidatus Harrisonbacteria bacterium CG10_big_fil_rev_8_21_14_0_10_38_8 TaxID=1974582 RepID=A0A2M6WJS5_9BACT|nr:MAG: SMC-Scp complex subunit ScpB [Candidatus Harrisonbacteria bacterium CG10_big_fil_rev_8_21_14_0_10_38_8]
MKQNKQASLEALLFIYGEAIEKKRILTTLNITEDELEKLLTDLRNLYLDEGRGVTLVFDETLVQMVTKSEYASIVEELIKADLKEGLSPAALETLSVVAYAGPVTRGEIDYIRGVNSSFILRSLTLRGLVDRSATDGRSYSYCVSLGFLKHLGVSEIAQLPEYERYKQVSEQLRSPKTEE